MHVMGCLLVRAEKGVSKRARYRILDGRAPGVGTSFLW